MSMITLETRISVYLVDVVESLAEWGLEGSFLNEIADIWFEKYGEEDLKDALHDAKNQLNENGQKLIHLLARSEHELSSKGDLPTSSEPDKKGRGESTK